MPSVVTEPADFEEALNVGDLKGIVVLYEEAATLRIQSGEARSARAVAQGDRKLAGCRVRVGL